MNFISPITKSALVFSPQKNVYTTLDNKETFQVLDNRVISFLSEKDKFYEGTYLNRVYFKPKSEKWYHTWPLWIISNGYLWKVRKHIASGSKVLELGCASGVDYFASRFEMIGLDLSLSSLKHLNNYAYAIHADASRLPLQDSSVDAIISSYFWEHIEPHLKDQMLVEFRRVLKPNGKIVFLYDVETDNSFINLLKKKDINLYNRLFLEKDGHVGYETAEHNKQRFLDHGFKVIEHFGMERTWLQSLSVYEKYQHLPGWYGWVGKIVYSLSKFRITTLFHLLMVRLVDETIGLFFSIKKSRILLSVLEKQDLK